jgi:hypothetical protein
MQTIFASRISYLADEIEVRRQNPVFRIILDYKVILLLSYFIFF